MTASWRVFSKATIGDGCWNWTACKTNGGYGRFVLNGRTTSAHRAALIVSGVNVPADMQVDHLCRNILCIRPSHLRVVSQHVNILASSAITAENARKTHCKRGHPLSGENLYERPCRGRIARQCKVCRNAATNASHQRRHP